MEREVKQEVEKIRGAYEPKGETESKLEKLRKLDGKVKLPAEIFAYVFGVAGALVLGVGMCLAMQIIGDLMPLGIVIGCVGIAMVSVNYPLYNAIMKARKKKYAAEVMALSDELINK